MSFPICPHCQHEFDSEEIWHTGSTDFPTENDGDETDAECLSCQTPLKIVLHLEPRWTFVDEDGEDITPALRSE